LLRDLAWVLATAPEPELRDAAQAVAFAERACALTRYRAIEPLDTLGVCYAAAGDFAEAIRATEQASRLAEVAGQPAIAERILERIELYQQGIPYRPPSTSVVPEDEAPKGGVGE
jgi:hypothetical protein